MGDTPDAPLIDRSPQPALSPAGFDALFAAVLDPAYGVAVRLTGNAADAEDLVQEAALRAFRAFASFVPGSNFKAWFLRILTNCFFTGYRKRQREPVVVEDDGDPSLYLYEKASANGLALGADDPGSVLLQRLEGAEIVSALDSLPDDYRVVSVLYFLEDLSYQDIADVLEIPVGTVRSRLHRGRKILQKALWQLAEEHGIVRELSSSEEGAPHD